MKKIICFLVIFMSYLLCGSIVFANSNESKIVVLGDDNQVVDTGTNALVGKCEILVPVETIKKYVYDNTMFDSTTNKVYVDFFLPNFRLETDKLDELLSAGVALNFPVKKMSGKPYINIYGLEKVFGISITEKEAGKVLIIRTGQNSYFSPLPLNKVRERQAISGKINLVWDHIIKESGDIGQENKIPGLDVLSPTWFAIVNEDGLVSNKADLKYIQDAHNKKYKVWALISNSFDKNLTRKVLNNERAKRNVIKQLVVYSSIYNLDGINIDFENIYDEDKDKLTQFIREITTALKEQNVTVSMDITVPSQTSYWSLCYDRQELGKIVDYVMVMTYDEHWRLSPISGSVASIGWVSKGISDTLRYIPKEKLLLGIPFYTREWEETIESGRIKVSSRALSMEQAENLVIKNSVKPVWLEDKGQFYVEYKNNDKQYKIWLEDEKSIARKAELVHKYGLAGAASWRKGFEKSQIWDVLNITLKKPVIK